MDELILIIQNESNEEFLKRLYDISNADYIQNEKWRLLKIKHLIKFRLKTEI
jgi:hypothetical protein